MFEILYDTFISYRRKGGADYAETIYDFLKLNGYKPFYDMTEMQNNRFDEQIRINLINCDNYILVLSSDSFERIDEDGDWLKKEITLAIHNNLNIIVLKENGFEFPESLPLEMKDLPQYQQYPFKKETLRSVLNDIETKLLKRSNLIDIKDPNPYGNINISGEYLTLYEDEDNGRVKICKAPATLKLFGNRITGKTTFEESNTWTIKGKIHKKRRITGIYYAESVLDDGFGTFFLEVKSPSILDGYWTGYDNVNGKVFSGKYMFKKIYKDYIVRDLEKSDYPKIIQISDRQLGKDYVTEELLAKTKDGQDCFCLVAFDQKTNRPIGCSICQIIDYSEVENICKQGDIKELKPFKYCEKIGYLKTVVVDKNYEGYGIGSRLVEACISRMKEEGCLGFISTAWKHAGIVNIANVLERSGFEKTKELPNYWYEDSQKEGYMCPQCGNPCHCSCVIYSKF